MIILIGLNIDTQNFCTFENNIHWLVTVKHEDLNASMLLSNYSFPHFCVYRLLSFPLC